MGLYFFQVKPNTILKCHNVLPIWTAHIACEHCKATRENNRNLCFNILIAQNRTDPLHNSGKQWDACYCEEGDWEKVCSGSLLSYLKYLTCYEALFSDRGGTAVKCEGKEKHKKGKGKIKWTVDENDYPFTDFHEIDWRTNKIIMWPLSDEGCHLTLKLL